MPPPDFPICFRWLLLFAAIRRASDCAPSLYRTLVVRAADWAAADYASLGLPVKGSINTYVQISIPTDIYVIYSIYMNTWYECGNGIPHMLCLTMKDQPSQRSVLQPLCCPSGLMRMLQMCQQLPQVYISGTKPSIFWGPNMLIPRWGCRQKPMNDKKIVLSGTSSFFSWGYLKMMGIFSCKMQ